MTNENTNITCTITKPQHQLKKNNKNITNTTARTTLTLFHFNEKNNTNNEWQDIESSGGYLK